MLLKPCVRSRMMTLCQVYDDKMVSDVSTLIVSEVELQMV